MENARRKIECFEDLFTWQKSIELVKDIYLITEKKGLKTDFGLKEQIRLEKQHTKDFLLRPMNL